MIEYKDCKNKGAFGQRLCSFEPRYDKSPPVGLSAADTSSAVFFSTNVDSFRRITYVRDVCTACGRTIEREGK